MKRREPVLVREAAACAAETAGLLWGNGWAERNGGNMSVNLGNGSFLVSVTGGRMRDLAKDPLRWLCLVRTRPGGGVTGVEPLRKSGGACRPTSELSTHLAVHGVLGGRGLRAVLHAHPTELIALSLVAALQDEGKLNLLLPAMYSEIAMVLPGGLGFIPYQLSGSGEIAKKTIPKFRTRDVVVWGKHGALAVGTDLADAFDRMDVLNKAAKIFFLVKSAGFKPDGLKAREIRALIKLAAASS